MRLPVHRSFYLRRYHPYIRSRLPLEEQHPQNAVVDRSGGAPLPPTPRLLPMSLPNAAIEDCTLDLLGPGDAPPIVLELPEPRYWPKFKIGVSLGCLLAFALLLWDKGGGVKHGEKVSEGHLLSSMD
ncbi:hypothetical protein BV25DRAFT_1822818 [Artomyces pyxidatus]|uniref:Uncharacterized protein n=1 Tax=Artomyces pyxidatus TaxID=48021 RepID=A0ACB8T6T4_9AGAM|nr:hypothetical protein BV25DRAFT_1822818 [Artomyces pyxidatus]